MSCTTHDSNVPESRATHRVLFGHLDHIDFGDTLEEIAVASGRILSAFSKPDGRQRKSAGWIKMTQNALMATGDEIMMNITRG